MMLSQIKRLVELYQNEKDPVKKRRIKMVLEQTIQRLEERK